MEGETPVASASNAAGQAEAEVRRAYAGASMVGSGSLSASPPEEAVVSSADLVRLSGQAEVEVRRAASTVDEISGSVSVLQDTVATCSSQYSYLDIALQQLVDNHAARSDASRDGGDVPERLMQRSEPSDDPALWKTTSSRRH